MLAQELAKKYRYENCAVIGISDGGVVVAEEVASVLHCSLMMLATAEITLPRELDPVAGMTDSGQMTFNSQFSHGEIEEMMSEFHGYIEQQKLSRMHDMNRLVGQGGITDKTMLRGHNVIVVLDGLKDSFALDIAADFLKPIAVEKFIVAAPLASVPAVDRMHVLADEVYCLSVIKDYFDTNHYYEDNNLPRHDELTKKIQDVILNWH